jgi:hypothetical protein
MNLVMPERETVFEIEAGGKQYRTTFGAAMDWANRRAPSIREPAKYGLSSGCRMASSRPKVF